MGRGNKSVTYCYECLRKYGKKGTRCEACNCDLRRVKSARVCSQVVTRLKRHRGLPTRHKGGYKAYLESKEWRTIRKRVLDRDGHTCRDCGAVATDVHHLSYSPAVMAGQDDSQLVSLCVGCHDERHPEKTSMAAARESKRRNRRL